MFGVFLFEYLNKRLRIIIIYTNQFLKKFEKQEVLNLLRLGRKLKTKLRRSTIATEQLLSSS
jgi:hypothetical protein